MRKEYSKACSATPGGPAASLGPTGPTLLLVLVCLCAGTSSAGPGTLVAASGAAAGDPLRQALALPQASLLVEDRGRTLISHHPDRAMVPASTMKILTALAAIDRWGLSHRFHTDFYLAHDDVLWVEGHADPYLVSEELDRIAQALEDRGIRSLSGIGIDDGAFDPAVTVDGSAGSSNPYDAPVTALAVNFNTVNLVKRGGSLASAEAQTPLTPLGRALARPLGDGTHRINLGERDKALRYFGEVFGAKLETAGIRVRGAARQGSVPANAKRVYRHENSRDLGAVLASMLEYSNNFIANVLFLALADQGEGRGPVDMALAQRSFAAWVERRFDWRGHRILDGAGLSRGNRLSARQLMDAVKAFAPYRTLLPAHRGEVRAKTGTLQGVSTYAGFVQRGGRWEPFSLLINQPVSPRLRLEVAEALTRGEALAPWCPGGRC